MKKPIGNHIVIEGADGAGKGLLTDNLREEFEASGFNVVCVREPGGTEFGEEMRHVLLTKRKSPTSVNALMLGFFASRYELYEKVTRPALEAGSIVLQDRWNASSYGYQVILGGANPDLFNSLVNHGNFLPAKMIYLDVDFEVSLDRRQRRGEPQDAMESLIGVKDRFNGLRRATQAYVSKNGSPGSLLINTSTLNPLQVLKRASKVLDSKHPMFDDQMEMRN